MVIERQYFKPLMCVAIGLVVLAISCTFLLVVQGLFSPFHVVVSDSMAPQIRDGDAVTIKSVAPEQIRVGQVVVFQDPSQTGRLLINRVVGVEGEGYGMLFTTRGDRNPETAWAQVSSSEVVGVMGSRLPYLGTVLRSLQSPDGFIICVAIPGACALALIFMLALSDKVEKAHHHTGVSISSRAAGAHSRTFF